MTAQTQTLPDDFGNTLRIALNDERIAFNSPDYHVNMGHWHKPDADIQCRTSVCLAGSVMANTFAMDREKEYGPGEAQHPHDIAALTSLDKIRTGQLLPAVADFYKIPVFSLSPDLIDYSNRDQAMAQLREMRANLHRQTIMEAAHSLMNLPSYPALNPWRPIKSRNRRREYEQAVRQQAEMDRMRRAAAEQEIATFDLRIARLENGDATWENEELLRAQQAQAESQVTDLIERIQETNNVLIKCFRGSTNLKLYITQYENDRKGWHKDMERIRDVALDHAV
jgi:hypothetical protein